MKKMILKKINVFFTPALRELLESGNNCIVCNSPGFEAALKLWPNIMLMCLADLRISQYDYDGILGSLAQYFSPCNTENKGLKEAFRMAARAQVIFDITLLTHIMVRVMFFRKGEKKHYYELGVQFRIADGQPQVPCCTLSHGFLSEKW